jgi:uncharacterized protein
VEEKKGTVIIAGGSGLIGTKLASILHQRGFGVRILSRSPSGQSGFFHWDPEKKTIDKSVFQGASALINLAGENIGAKRWTAHRKRRIINSRLVAANFLYETLSSTSHSIELFAAASAVGIYGNTGERIIHEDFPASDDFLGQTAVRWEQANRQAESLGIRTVIIRIGVVLSEGGGIMEELRKPISFGVYPVLGSGDQYMSWIHIDDLCRIFVRSINDHTLSGVYNGVGPGPISMKNFIKLYKQIKGGWGLLIPVPSFALKLLLGEMSSIVLEGQRVSSEKIEMTGFKFNFIQANQAIRNVIGK